MMQQSSKRFISMVLALAFIVGAFLVFFEMVQPAYSNLEDLKGREISSEQLLQSETNIVAQVKKLITQSQSDQSAVSDLALAMPSGPDMSGALAQVYGIAQNNGITLTAISISPPRAVVRTANASTTLVRPMGTLSLQLSGNGSYEALKNFLSELETNIRVFDVTSLAIQPVAGSSSGASTTLDAFSYNITASTYYQLPQ